jgi:hypothetical protein
MAENQTLLTAQKLEIILTPDSVTNNSAKDDFKLAMHSLLKFPGGWRLQEGIGLRRQEGIQWVSFPSNLADAKTVRESSSLVTR